MYILGKKWLDSFLDYSMGEGEVRIQVSAWANVTRVSGVFIERPRSVVMVWQYIKEVGIRAVIRKVRSRMSESLRNRVYYSIGLGRIVQASDPRAFRAGLPVAFVAPSHPACVERVVLPAGLVRAVPGDIVTMHESPDGIAYYHEGPEDALEEGLFGWHTESGTPINPARMERTFDAIEEFWSGKSGTASVLPLKEATPIRESIVKTQRSSKAPLRAVLLGLGNYAKTQIIPNVKPSIQIETVYEINPTQIGEVENLPWSVSTSPSCCDDRRYDVHFAAGYHHTHADQAVAALKSGAVAVVEKPLVTTEEQLERLLETLKDTQGKLFTCFHMRYNPLFSLARNDLEVDPGDPVHCCCDVFEIPLPRYHWYRWPNSGSHLISNGCHWMDHFLFMNDYSTPTRYHVIKSSSGDTSVNAELENGAVFNLHLTHVGSPRIGVQDHVVMRANGCTVTVTNGATYLAENRVRIIRKKRINRLNAYRRMYRTIADAIVQRKPGDSERSIVVMNQFMLALEKQWQAL